MLLSAGAEPIHQLSCGLEGRQWLFCSDVILAVFIRYFYWLNMPDGNSNVIATSIVKLGKGGNVNTDVPLRISVVLNCEVSDIVGIVKDNRTPVIAEKETVMRGNE